MCGRYFAQGLTLLFTALERRDPDQRNGCFHGEPSASSYRLVEVFLCSALLTGHPAGPWQPVGVDGSYAESQGHSGKLPAITAQPPLLRPPVPLSALLLTFEAPDLNRFSE